MVYKNHYFIMRHGESEANLADLIVSDPDIGCAQYGLSSRGREQARHAALQFAPHPFDLIVCSDFKRTKETALIVADVLGVETVIEEPKLRERFFGKWEGQTSAAYAEVWEKDKLNPAQTDNEVESAERVRARALAVVVQLESQYDNKAVLLVSHGDTLQILSTQFHGVEAGQHRQLPHHNTGEIKPLLPTP